MRRVRPKTPSVFLLPAMLFGACLAPVAGCGESRPATAPVSGRVTFEGRPLPGGGSILLVPIDAAGNALPGKAAMATVAEDGTYTLGTYGADDGAIIGQHRVEVRQNRVLRPAEYAEDEMKMTRPEVRLPEADRIPDVYFGPNSPLRAKVEDKDNQIDFDLERGGG